MSNQLQVKMSLLEASKETDNKLRWDSDISDAKFQLYIPKWRVPLPWPKTIQVTITPISSDSEVLRHGLTPQDCRDEPAKARSQIVAIVRATEPKSKTFRYDPVGDPKQWEIGSPYIPYALTHEESPFLKLLVDWF